MREPITIYAIAPELQPYYKHWAQMLHDTTLPQGRSTLKSLRGTYCCLGILATEACSRDTWDHLSILPNRNLFSDHSKLPAISTARLFPDDSNTQGKFATLNDDFKMTFQDIAGVIERALSLAPTEYLEITFGVEPEAGYVFTTKQGA